MQQPDIWDIAARVRDLEERIVVLEEIHDNLILYGTPDPPPVYAKKLPIYKEDEQ